MTRLRLHAFFLLLMTTMVVGLQAQSAVSAPAVAANATVQPGQGRGITAVTRRTLMVAPGQQANAFFAAGGINVATPAPAAAILPAAAPAAPVAAIISPGLQRPEVQAALRQLAGSGNAQARQLLRQSASGAATAASVPKR